MREFEEFDSDGCKNIVLGAWTIERLSDGEAVSLDCEINLIPDSAIYTLADEPPHIAKPKHQKDSEFWKAVAIQHHRNEEYYRDLLDQIGKTLGEDAYIARDGSRSDSVLRAKLPELVAELKARKG